MKVRKTKKPRAQGVITLPCRGKVGMYWWTIPLDSKGRFIPSSVDCLYNQEYYSREDAGFMVTSL